jgi:hypothetical protein
MAKVALDTPAAAALPPLSGHAELVEFSRDTIEATGGSNAALSAALEAIGWEFAQYVHTAFVSAGETARGLLGARTLEDVVRLHTDFAERSFAGLIERSTNLSRLGCAPVGAGVGAWDARAKS